VAFFLLMALNRALRAEGFFNHARPEPNLTALLDLVALATVADVMPLKPRPCGTVTIGVAVIVRSAADIEVLRLFLTLLKEDSK
jgi:single-stranded-DNA-specific exonuclease